MTRDDVARMEYEEIYVSVMTRARQVYLAKMVAEQRHQANLDRIKVLQKQFNPFSRKQRLLELAALQQENEQIEQGFAVADDLLVQLIAKLDEMEPHLGDRACLYARDKAGRWLRRQ